MKNAIAYYYNLYSYDIHQKQGVYRFTVQNEHYVLTPCDVASVEQSYKLSRFLWSRGIYTHQIILNNNNQIYTLINNINYVLLKLQGEMNEIATYKDIIYFTSLVNYVEFEDLNHQNWAILWGEKIDYFEYQVNQFGKRYPLIRESFSYYVGMAETGITLFVNANIDLKNRVVAHKRMKSTSTLYDLYNPLNLIIDFKVRDAAEYFKDLFLTKEDIYSDIINYFSYNYLSTYDCFIFYIRLFYPSFYFDAYEDIIAGNIEEGKLKDIIKKTNQYESLLKRLYIYLSNYMNMPDIEWIKK